MVILGYHIKPNEIADSNGNITTVPSWFRALLIHSGEDCIKVFYHLNYSVACLLRMIEITEAEAKALYSKGELYIGAGNQYKLSYIPGKFFSLKDKATGGFASFSDMSQYNRRCQLSDEDDPIAKAVAAWSIGQEVYDALRSINLQPKSLVSPIRPWEVEVLDDMDLPTIDDIPEQAAQFAYKCCHGGWVEAFQKGSWDNAYDYDIRSAYGYHTAQLLDIRHGKWVKKKQCIGAADYGFVRCKVTITKPFSPIIFGDGDQQITPVGTWETYLTKDELDFITHYNLGEYEILEGHWWIAKDWILPLKTMIDYLYYAKEHAEGLSRDVIKRVITGVWGKLLESREEEFGKRFNPVWAAIVESRTRLEVARACLDRGVIPLHIAVDGVLTDRPFYPPFGDSGAMGDWKLSSCSPAIVVSSGICAVKDKATSGDFGLDYDWLIEQIKTNPKASEYKMHKMSPVTLGKALNLGWLDKLGNLNPEERSVIIHSKTDQYEAKRVYRQEPKCGGDLLTKKYQSQPLHVDMAKLAMTIKRQEVNQ